MMLSYEAQKATLAKGRERALDELAKQVAPNDTLPENFTALTATSALTGLLCTSEGWRASPLDTGFPPGLIPKLTNLGKFPSRRSISELAGLSPNIPLDFTFKGSEILDRANQYICQPSQAFQRMYAACCNHLPEHEARLRSELIGKTFELPYCSPFEISALVPVPGFMPEFQMLHDYNQATKRGKRYVPLVGEYHTSEALEWAQQRLDKILRGQLVPSYLDLLHLFSLCGPQAECWSESHRDKPSTAHSLHTDFHGARFGSGSIYFPVTSITPYSRMVDTYEIERSYAFGSLIVGMLQPIDDISEDVDGMNYTIRGFPLHDGNHLVNCLNKLGIPANIIGDPLLRTVWAIERYEENGRIFDRLSQQKARSPKEQLVQMIAQDGSFVAGHEWGKIFLGDLDAHTCTRSIYTAANRILRRDNMGSRYSDEQRTYITGLVSQISSTDHEKQFPGVPMLLEARDILVDAVMAA